MSDSSSSSSSSEDPSSNDEESELGEVSPTFKPPPLTHQRSMITKTYIAATTAHPPVRPNVLSKISIWWITSLIWRGMRKTITQKDIWDVPSTLRAERILSIFTHHWTTELKKKKPRLWRASIKTLFSVWVLSGLLFVIWELLQLLNPLLLEMMIIYISDDSVATWWGYFYLFFMVFGAFLGSFCLYYSIFIAITAGMRIRGALMAAIYYKSLRISSAARQKINVGYIVNLMSNDAQRILDTFHFLNYGIFAPVQIVGCIALLYLLIGPFTFVCVGIMLLFVPINYVVANRLLTIRRSMVIAIDERVKVENELLQGIRIIKYYAWEGSFLEKVKRIRKIELNKILKFGIARAVLFFVMNCAPTVMIVATFVSYAADDNELDPQTTFAVLALLNLVRMPVNFLPVVVAITAQNKVALDRISAFLAMPEVEQRTEEGDKDIEWQKGEEDLAVRVENTDWKWEDTAETPTLSGINFELKIGELMMIVGPVGSGKSTILAGLLREVKQVEGPPVAVRGSIAYASQQAWVMNASLRDNITFGQPFDEQWYWQVVAACALTHDLSLFPAGDMTEVGERGINMSGGQKQRLSIARAVYRRSDVYLFDDPLSAVDAHVGKHIFREVFRKLLKGRTVILVTNQLQYLPHADKILVIGPDGRMLVPKITTYDELSKNTEVDLDALLKYGEDEAEAKGAEADERDVDGEKEEESEEEEESESESESGTNGGNDAKGQLVQKEDQEAGNVSLKVYIHYIIYGGGIPLALLLLLFGISSMVTRSFLDLWLAFWSDDRFDKLEENDGEPWWYIQIYIAIAVADAIVQGALNIAFVAFGWLASRRLHQRLLQAVVRAPVRFFDVTPLGRILNRFSKDQDLIDTQLPGQMQNFYITFWVLCATVIVISIGVWWVLIGLPFLAVFYYFLQKYFRKTAIELQRLESVTRSPIFSHFSETLTGVTTIRAYGLGPVFEADNLRHLDSNARNYYTLAAAQQWFGMRLDWISTAVLFMVLLIIVILREDVDIALSALAITYALQATSMLNQFSRFAAETETKMNSVERIVSYSKIQPEAPPIIPDSRPPSDWPSQGRIEFQNVRLRYREDTELVLNGVTFTARPREKIGIVGRTGAGKSSLMVVLFRMTEPEEGEILIDGIDISRIGLADLRSRLSIIPQDPTLFVGSLRTNLDPFHQHTDEEIWNVLELVQLDEYVRKIHNDWKDEEEEEETGREKKKKKKKKKDAHGGGAIKRTKEEEENALLIRVQENGENFSVGQRQLICLGRALLRNSRILVLDEATASIDVETDDLVQKTVREQFGHCTVLTIAHRLNTIMDSDRILVMDKGRVEEFDTPVNLLADEESVFSGLVRDTGKATDRHLRAMAKEHASVNAERKKKQKKKKKKKKKKKEKVRE